MSSALLWLKHVHLWRAVGCWAAPVAAVVGSMLALQVSTVTPSGADTATTDSQVATFTDVTES